MIYKHRWQVELFFRWLKCMAHLEHFFSESPQGMTLQLYVTLIATLLIALETGARPSVYDFSLMSLVMSGLASLEEALVVAAKRRAERERAARRRREHGDLAGPSDRRVVLHMDPVDGDADQFGCLEGVLELLAATLQPDDQVGDGCDVGRRGDLFLGGADALTEPGEIEKLHDSSSNRWPMPARK